MKRLVLLLAFALATSILTACDPQGSDDALIGGWTRMRAETAEVRDHFSFATDGAITFDENKPDDRATEDHLRGTYVVSDGVVTATVTDTQDGKRSRVTFTYHANDTVFSPEALRAPAGHTGVVGVWNRIIKFEDASDPTRVADGAVGTFDFRADGSFRWTVTPFEDNVPVTVEGTWGAESTDTFRASVRVDSSTPTNDVVFKLLDGEALIPDGYVWQRD